MYVEYLPGEKHATKDADVSESLDTFKDAGYLLTDTDLVIDIDDLDQYQIEQMIDRFDITTQVVWTTRGAHLYFKKPTGFRGAKSLTALGCSVEYKHIKNTKSITVKQNGQARKVDNKGIRETLPEFLRPLRKAENLLGLDEGDGRNQKLFKHRMTIGNMNDWQLICTYINEVLFATPLPDSEMDQITRDVVVEAVKDAEPLIADTVMREKRVVKYAKQLYFYNDGEYISDEDKLIRIVFNYCKGQKTKYVKEVIDQMSGRAPLVPDNKTFDIRLKNGILRDGEFIEVDYTDFTPYSIPIEVDFDARSVQKVDDYLDHLTDHDECYKLRLMEILGHCLIVDKEFKRLMGKFFIFVGDGGNGKGTLLTVIRAILNSKNCAGLSIANMTDERYLNVLSGKLANLGDDIQDQPINNEQMKLLKNISTCDFVEIRKLYTNANSVELTPTLIFTSNHVIKSFEKGGSYKRRVDWLPMYGKPKKKDPRFITNLTTDEALKYWIKMIVEGYMRLYKNQKFTESDKVKQFNDQYHIDNNSAIEFINDLKKEDIIGKKSPEIYQEYETWAEENGVNVQSKKLVKDTIYAIYGLEIKAKKINGKTCKVYQEIPDKKVNQ
ncbi:DNA primase family protein [Melissococcus plutonius]|uniref:DNA primase family protein n=1 Tax=Melissococcus plutonius TaxID=33970 RepID=UPI003C2DFFA1